MMRSIAFVVAGTALLAATPASAQPAAAESLFREGKRLMGEGKLPEACAAFEGSYRKDPVVTTLLNLADCREKNQQYASAWGHFIDADRMTRGKNDQATLNATARTRAGKLEPRLSYLIINVPDEARVEGLEITRNGVVVDGAEWNRDIPVDGGAYTVSGKAPAFEAWSAKVTVGVERDKQSVNVPRFRALPAGAVGGVSGGTGATGSGAASGAEPSSFTGKRKLALAAWAVGAVGLGAGVALELSARASNDDSKVEPDDTRQRELHDSANQKRLFATISVGVGAAAVVGGVYLWVTGKPALETSGVSLAPALAPDHAGFVLAGHF